MGQVLTADIINDFEQVAATIVRMPGSSLITVGGQQYRNNADMDLDMSASGFGGLDTGSSAIDTTYNIYAVYNGIELGLVASLSNTIPSGFNAGTKVAKVFTNSVNDAFPAPAESSGRIGDTQQSMLSEEAFRAQNGAGWILMDGRSVVGTKYETITGDSVVPDARGIALRGKNNGRVDGNENPDGDAALGTFQDHMTSNTGLSVPSGGSHPHTQTQVAINFGGGRVNVSNSYSSEATFTNAAVNILATGSDHTHTITGGNETRMKNVTVNTFIKIDP